MYLCWVPGECNPAEPFSRVSLVWGHEATETGFEYAPVSQAHGHNHIVHSARGHEATETWLASSVWGGGGGLRHGAVGGRASFAIGDGGPHNVGSACMDPRTACDKGTTRACGVNSPSSRLIFWCFMRGGPHCLLAYGRGWLQVAGGVGSPVPDVPSPGAENKHNGQLVAQPGEGPEGICGKGRAPAMARGWLGRRPRVAGLVALKWCGNWVNAMVFSLPFACDCPPTTVVILHAETGCTTVLSPVAAAGPVAYGPT